VRRLILALVLPGVAGAVNATSLLAFGLSVSHVTGHVARIGDELAQSRHASRRCEQRSVDARSSVAWRVRCRL
jgi:uncharacterized membrane protein YoaK (UPF0700 family)